MRSTKSKKKKKFGFTLMYKFPNIAAKNASVQFDFSPQ